MTYFIFTSLIDLLMLAFFQNLTSKKWLQVLFKILIFVFSKIKSYQEWIIVHSWYPAWIRPQFYKYGENQMEGLVADSLSGYINMPYRWGI